MTIDACVKAEITAVTSDTTDVAVTSPTPIDVEAVQTITEVTAAPGTDQCTIDVTTTDTDLTVTPPATTDVTVTATGGTVVELQPGAPFSAVGIAGAGLTKTGTTFDVVATDASLAVAADSVGVQLDGNSLEITSNGVRVNPAALDHGALVGLADDDHVQYIHIDGRRAFIGDIDAGGNDIINVNTVDGVDVSAHAARHTPAGADPIATAAATGLDGNTTNTEGTANTLARSDHEHDIDTTTGTLSTVNAGDTADKGTAAGLAPLDHQHPVATDAPVAVGSANTEGTSNTLARSDHEHAHHPLRIAIHLASRGPFEGFPAGAVFERQGPAVQPTGWIWWESAAKTDKIIEEQITYNVDGSVAAVDRIIYDEDGTTVLRTFTDTTAAGGAETTRA